MNDYSPKGLIYTVTTAIVFVFFSQFEFMILILFFFLCVAD